MKIAHSNLLGHLFEAKDATAKDVSDLLIVCPECRSPVYKMKRGDSENAQHFFSHYPAQKDTAKECELRMARYTPDRIAKDTHAERANNLKFFIAALDEMLTEVVEKQRGEIDREDRMLLQKIAKSKNITKLKQEVTQLAIGAIQHEEDVTKNRLGLDSRHSYENGMIIRPRLRYEHQKGYAEDLFATLIRPECKTAYTKLQNYAWLLTLNYFHMHAEDPKNDALVNFCFAFTIGNFDACKYWHGYLKRGDIPQIKAVFTTYIHQILLSIDYGKWLLRRRNEVRLQRLRWTPDRVFNPAAKKRRPKPKRTHKMKKHSEKQRKAG
jgi:hypothetical protein